MRADKIRADTPRAIPLYLMAKYCIGSGSTPNDSRRITKTYDNMRADKIRADTPRAIPLYLMAKYCIGSGSTPNDSQRITKTYDNHVR